MHIAILDFATPFAGMEDRPRAGDLILDWIAPALPEAEFSILSIALGDPLPAAEAFDGYVLSGSEQGVYDRPDWMDGLRAFLLAAQRAERPMVGICFGHQIMADVFGGRAGKVDFGNVVGARRFVIDGIERDVHVWHQDQVTHVPPGAVVTGGAAYCPAGVLRYGFPAYSVQFHPEYTAAMLRDEIETVAGGALSAELAEAALVSMAQADVAPDLVAREAAEVLRLAGGELRVVA